MITLEARTANRIIPFLGESGIIVNAEMFLQNKNAYHALYKVDTVILANTESELIANLVDTGFEALFKKVVNKSLSQMHMGKTELSYNDIKKHVEDFSNFPILNDSILNRGVYVNFNDFKNNKPSITVFEVKKGALSDELFIIENNQNILLQNFWGYCDGSKFFILSVHNLFPLIRSRNTFNTRALNQLDKTRMNSFKVNRLAGSIFLDPQYKNIPMYKSDNTGKTYTEKPTAFQLDMQNGELY